MPIKNVLFLFSIIICFHSNAQVDSYFLIDSYYKGNPKSVVNSTFSVSKDSASNEIMIIQRKEVQVDFFNENGKCISHQWQDLQNDTLKEFTFNYDAFGNRIEFKIFENSVVTDRYLTLFDSNQNEIGVEVYDASNILSSKTTIERTIDADTETTIRRNLAGEIDSKRISTLDSLGREIKCLIFKKHQNLSIEHYFNYNNNQLIEYTSIRPYVDTFINTYTYDTLGRQVEIKQYNKTNGRSQFSYITVFHDSINQREYHDYSYGELTSISYHYLDSNDCVRKIIVLSTVHPTRSNRLKNEESNESETRFVYDARLNWIEKTDYFNGEITRIMKREFDYY